MQVSDCSLHEVNTYALLQGCILRNVKTENHTVCTVRTGVHFNGFNLE